MKKQPVNWSRLRTALVTGASSGLGATFARHLAQKGMDLILIARREEKLKRLAQELIDLYQIKVETMTFDISERISIVALYKLLLNRNDIDVLVSNAGMAVNQSFARIDMSLANQNLDLHCLAPLYLTNGVIKKMIAQNQGIIIYTSSLASWLPSQGGLYPASKAFLTMWAQCLNIDLQQTEVRVQALCPGFFHSEFHQHGLEKLKQTIPGYLWMTTEQVVSASLKGLDKNQVIVVPGLKYRFGKWLLTHNWLGKHLVKWLNRHATYQKKTY